MMPHEKLPFFCFLFCLIFSLSCGGTDTNENRVQIDAKNKTLSFEATFHPKGFEQSWSMPGYHLIVWKDGGASKAALFRAEVNDRKILESLLQLGAKPGDNLKMESWECRKDPSHSAPEIKAKGPKVSIRVQWPETLDSIPVHQLFEGGKEDEFEFRFTGNAQFIDQWKSGCISCLYSCPGGKVVNAAYTIRDYTKNQKRFRLSQDISYPEGTSVRVIMKMESIPSKVEELTAEDAEDAKGNQEKK